MINRLGSSILPVIAAHSRMLGILLAKRSEISILVLNKSYAGKQG